MRGTFEKFRKCTWPKSDGRQWATGDPMIWSTKCCITPLFALWSEGELNIFRFLLASLWRKEIMPHHYYITLYGLLLMSDKISWLNLNWDNHNPTSNYIYTLQIYMYVYMYVHTKCFALRESEVIIWNIDPLRPLRIFIWKWYQAVLSTILNCSVGRVVIQRDLQI